MSSKFLFSVQTPSLQLIYEVLASQPAPCGSAHYFVVQHVDEEDSEHVEGPGVQMRAELKVAPFDANWERVELWGRNCSQSHDGDPNFTIEDVYGFEILEDFQACKVYVPQTVDRNVHESKLIWWEFPCTRACGAPIYADKVVFMLDGK